MEIQVGYNQIQPKIKIMARNEPAKLPNSYALLQRSRAILAFYFAHTPKSSSLIGFSIINHPFWGTPIFGNTPECHSLFGRFSVLG